MNRAILLRSTALACLLASAAAHAGLFPTYPTGTGPGVWEVDRYPPAAFSNGGTLFGWPNALNLDLSSNDSAANRPPAFSAAFYNTQGRGIQTDFAAYSVLYGSVYLPSGWATTNPGNAVLNRRTELWGVLSPATGGDTCPASACNLFPIVGFTNASASDPLNAGGAGRFRVFDSNIGFVDLPTAVPYDAWSDVCIAFPGAELRFYVNGALVYTQSSLVQSDTSFGPPTKWSRTTMQAYNFGTSYASNWSGLGGGKLAGASVASGSGQSTPVSTPFAIPLKVVATDAGGAPLPCVPVTFASPGSGASAVLSATNVVTNMQGEATVTATANAIAGAYVVTATAPGIAPVQFNLTNASVPPTLAKAFSPSIVEAQKLSTLTITIGNATGSPYTLTAPFVDAMPVYLNVATTQAGTCAGVTTTLVNITMAAGTVVPAGGCTIVVSVYALRAGLYTNTTSALATSAGNASPATAVLTALLAPPVLTKTFLPLQIPAGGTALVAIGVSHSNVGPPGTVYLTQPFVDAMPAGLTIRGGSSGTCGAGVVGNSIVWTQGPVPGTCTIVVEVTALAAGTYVNTTGPLMTNAGTAAPASAVLTVTGSLLFTASGGGSQQATVNTAYGAPLRATVASADGAPLAGIVVTFALPASGPSATFAGGGATAIATTDSTGVATSPVLTANGVAGSFSATASAAGVAGAIQFSLTNVASAPAIPVPALGPLGLILLVAGVGIAAVRSGRRRGRTMQ